VSTRVEQHAEPPPAIRDLDELGSHYLDLFVATVADAEASTPEQWARATMEGAHPAGRFLAWRLALALQLEQRPSAEHIAGWTITGRGDGWIRVQAHSWCMTPQIVFRVEPDQVWFATFMRYDRAAARWIWGAVSAVHRRVAPDFLRGGVRRIRRERG
jgi:hypothetical protein